MGFPGGSVVKNLPARQEMWVWSLGQEDPLEKGLAIHSSILAWRIPRTGELKSMGLQRVRHHLVTKQQHIYIYIYMRFLSQPNFPMKRVTLASWIQLSHSQDSSPTNVRGCSFKSLSFMVICYSAININTITNQNSLFGLILFHL